MGILSIFVIHVNSALKNILGALTVLDKAFLVRTPWPLADCARNLHQRRLLTRPHCRCSQKGLTPPAEGAEPGTFQHWPRYLGFFVSRRQLGAGVEGMVAQYASQQWNPKRIPCLSVPSLPVCTVGTVTLHVPLLGELNACLGPSGLIHSETQS